MRSNWSHRTSGSAAHAVGLVAMAFFALFLVQLTGHATTAEPAASADAKYVGAEKCKNCHRAKTRGDQYGAWKESKLSKAFETLASDKAKEVGKKAGVDDPQKSDKCLKCHTTAAGEPADHLAKGFDAKLGVQCESCHGPGEAHVKARMAAQGDEEEAAKVDPAELAKEIKRPTVDNCKSCHNPQNPTHTDFCMKELWAKAAHLDPKDKAGHDRLATIPCECPKCAKK